MIRWRYSFATFARAGLTVGVALALADAFAAQRTFVASYGNDLNACSLALPCRSFGRAITQTNVDGEIVVLDSAGYGSVTVDKAVSIVAPAGVYAGISVFASGTGVIVNAPGANVTLRGLTINGQGGNDGISFVAGAELHVERCFVAFLQGNGIVATATGSLSVDRTTLRSNGSSGIVMMGDVETTLHAVTLERNGQYAIDVEGNARLGATRIVADGNGSHGMLVFTGLGIGNPQVVIESSMIAGNGGDGIQALASDASNDIRIAVARSTLAHNQDDGTDLAPLTSGGNVHASFADNLIAGNGNSGIVLNQSGSGLARIIASTNRVVHNDVGFTNNGAIPANATFETTGNNMVRRNIGNNVVGTITALSGD